MRRLSVFQCMRICVCLCLCVFMCFPAAVNLGRVCRYVCLCACALGIKRQYVHLCVAHMHFVGCNAVWYISALGLACACACGCAFLRIGVACLLHAICNGTANSSRSSREMARVLDTGIWKLNNAAGCSNLHHARTRACQLVLTIATLSFRKCFCTTCRCSASCV